MLVHYPSLLQKGNILPHVWQELTRDDPPPWMWGNGEPLTVTEFILYFSTPDRHLFLACTPDGANITGILWVDELAIGQRARVHFYFFKKYRFKKSTAVKRTCQEGLQILANPPFNLRILLLFTDTRATVALKLARQLGGQFLGFMPDYYPGGSMVEVGYLSLKGY